MDGRIEITQGTLFDILMLGAANLWRQDGAPWLRLLQKSRGMLRWLSSPNGILRARRNAAHHYDLDAVFYVHSWFLDSGLSI